jgi:dTDP-4-dehydrorhamnose reductase
MLGAGALVVFSISDVVYGDTQDTLVDEFTPTNPYGEYAIQKSIVENEFKRDQNFLALRISSVIGEGSNLRKLLLSQEINEIFDPVIRTPIHIKDLGDICNGLIKSNFRQDFPNGILNIGGSRSMSNFEVALLEAKALGIKCPVAASRSTIDKECRPGTVRMLTTKAQEFANLSLDLNQHYE